MQLCYYAQGPRINKPNECLHGVDMCLLAHLSLSTRSSLQEAVRSLFLPLLPYFSQGKAKVVLPGSGAYYTLPGQGLEGFARPLWGLAPLAAGGGDFSYWHLYIRGLTAGTDPQHPEYWGQPSDYDQRFVECASLSTAILLCAEQVWTPLNTDARHNLVNWLGHINQCKIPDNNWMFFRVLVNCALRHVGFKYDAAALTDDLDRIESFYVGDGWYTDGPQGSSRDYYCAFAIHYYALIYATVAAEFDPDRAQRFKHRACEFAHQFQHWFNAEGKAFAYGRSMTYRFAQGAFWGALAFADVEALPWGAIKGLALRHLRQWLGQPIFHGDGTLSVGYGYPNLLVGEDYNGPGSPYWAMKFFLPLALPASHPFWQAEEVPLPSRPAVVHQPTANMILSYDQADDNVTALTAGQTPAFRPTHVGEKYNKFAYSTAFSFCVPWGRDDITPDSTLSLSEDGWGWRERDRLLDACITSDGAAYSKWRPWADVEVQTWLWPQDGWHLRLHYIRTRRELMAIEGGFAVNIGQGTLGLGTHVIAGLGSCKLLTPCGASGIVDFASLHKDRPLRAGNPTPVLANRNLLHPRVMIPTLKSHLSPGEHWLSCGVLACVDHQSLIERWIRVQNYDIKSHLTRFIPSI